MAYTLLDAAYEMYYPEAEFGLLDRGRAALSGVGRKAKSYARLGGMKAKKYKKNFRLGYKTGRTEAAAKRWNKGGGAMLRQTPEMRGLMREMSTDKVARRALPRRR